MDHNDCLPCHFDWEEEHVFPLLPPDVRAWLQAEHDELRALGFPPHLVLSHAHNEVPYFRLYCPPWMVKFIEDDHTHLEQQIVG